MNIFKYCVYTIKHGDCLARDEKNGSSVDYTERRRWVAGSELLQHAQQRNEKMPLLLADATDCSTLVYWGFLKNIEVHDDHTNYTIERVLRLAGDHKPQELILKSTSKPIAANYIRPYAICFTPDFVGI